MREEKRARAAEAAKSPRKSSRLSAAGADDASGEQCDHVLCTLDEIHDIFAEIEASKYPPFCEHPGCGVTGWSKILVCTGCSSHFCIGVVTKGRPQGHALIHARSHGVEHWFALWYNDPLVGHCYACRRNMTYHLADEEDVGAGGHVAGPANGHGYTGTGNASGYVVRGMPNLGNTCYLNALVQCLLVLGKLRERMLGSDALTGSHGSALQYLFAKTNCDDNAGDMLDPTQLLAYIYLGDSRFKGNNMQDSHELLVYLRNVLHEEEKVNGPAGMQMEAPSVTESIFGGQLCVTRTCKCCSIKSVSHDVFYDLSMSLPSKRGPPAKSVASSPGTKGAKSQKKIRINLRPAIDRINEEKTKVIAESGDSQKPGSKLEDELKDKTPKPLEVDSTEAEQIRQSKYAVHGSLQTQKDDDPGESVEVPVEAVDFLPQNVLLDVKVQGMVEPTADSYSPLVSPSRENSKRMTSGSDVKKNGIAGLDETSIEVKENSYSVEVTKADNGGACSSKIVHDDTEDVSSLVSIEDCLAQYFEAEVIKKFCENCAKVAERVSINTCKDGEQMIAGTSGNTTVDDSQTVQSDKKICQSEQSSDLKSLAVECASSGQPHGSDAQHQFVFTADRTTEGITSGMNCNGDPPSCSTANKKPECHEEGIQEAVPDCLPTEKQTNILSAQDNQNASTLNEHNGKQAKLDHSAHQVEQNQNELKDMSGYATETRFFSKLPPVLIIHFKRTVVGHVKVRGHVRFKEILDVGPFMDPSSEEKSNFSYHLVGVIEHRGDLCAEVGHYVAYVRPSDQQQSAGPSAWFFASDNDIREVSLEDVLMCEAYILFYERIEG